VIINYFHINRSSLGPSEADPILIVDPHAVLALPIASQRFQAIPLGIARSLMTVAESS
jgi:hypothetical protein